MAKADRASSSIPWTLTAHAAKRIVERVGRDPDVVRAALLAARRLPEDAARDSVGGVVHAHAIERWAFEVDGRSFIAVAGIDEENAVRTVFTVVPPDRARRAGAKRAVVPPKRPDLG